MSQKLHFEVDEQSLVTQTAGRLHVADSDAMLCKVVDPGEARASLHNTHRAIL